MKARWKWIMVASIILLSGAVLALYAALKAYDFNSLKPTITRTVEESTGLHLSMGELSLRIGLTPALVVEDVKIQNPSWASRPELIKIRRLEIELALMGLFMKEVQVRRIVLIEPDIQIEWDKAGVPNVVSAFAKREEQKEGWQWPRNKLHSLSVRKMTLDKAKIGFKDTISSSVRLFSMDRLEATAEDFRGPMSITSSGSWLGKPFTAQAITGSMEDLMSPGRPWPVKANVETLSTHLVMNGSISEVFAGKGLAISFQADGNSPTEILEFLDLGMLGPVGAFKVSGNLSDPGKGTYLLSDLSMETQTGELSGRVEINVSGKRPNLNGLFELPSLDLTPFFPTREIPSEKRRGPKIFSETPVKVDLPSQFDGDMKIRARQITTPLGLMNDVQVQANLKEGRLTLIPLNVGIGEGLVEGHLTLVPEGKHFSLYGGLKIHKVELRPLLKAVTGDDAIEGMLDGEMDLKSSGESVATLMAKLTGRSTLAVGNGRVKNQYIKRIAGDAAGPALALLGTQESRVGYADIHCALSILMIKDGLANVVALVVDTPGTTVYGTGDIDLKTEKLNIKLEPLPKKGVAGMTLSLKELAKPMKMAGTIAEPSLSVDAGRTAMVVGKAVGGFVLFGPFGILGALAGKTSQANPCAAALEAAKKEAKESGKKKETETKQKKERHEKPVRDIPAGHEF